MPMLLSNLYAENERYLDAIITENTFMYGYAENNVFNLESALLGFYLRVLPSKVGYLKEMTNLVHT